MISWKGAGRIIAGLILALAICAGFGARTAYASALTASPAQYDRGITVIHADLAASTGVLPGRTQELWAFGDTSQVNGHNMVGGLAHFTMALEKPGSASFHPLRGPYGPPDTLGRRYQQVPNFSDGTFFWPHGVFVTGSTLWVPGVRVDKSGKVHNAEIAKFAVSSLRFLGITQLPGAEVWGSSVATRTGHYLVGTRNVCSHVNDCKVGDVAFVPNGDEARPSRWTVTKNAFPASLNVGTVISPLAHNGAFLAYTKQGDSFGGKNKIEELRAPRMTGRWALTGRTWPTTHPAGAITYHAELHPSDSPAGRLLVSYAVNHFPSGQYDPNFLDITP